MENKNCKIPIIMLLIMMGAMFTGCASKKPDLYKTNLRASIDAIKVADWATADTHIANAKANAQNHEQERQVQSLEKLVEGGKAMDDGNVAEAKKQWSQIRDPYLNREIREKSQAVAGIEVPMIPENEGELK
ncbi:MAG: hypothetical protein JEZ07_04755 [Phycisphaerae bacterium]|nr:hypothetical protein [Phycisphaerae bacterium]